MVESISAKELKNRLESDEDFKLINVLSEESFNEEHIPGSRNIPTAKIDKKAEEELDKSEEIIVYCASFQCGASPKAAQKLEEFGYKNVIDYEGGMKKWKEEGYPVKG